VIAAASDHSDPPDQSDYRVEPLTTAPLWRQAAALYRSVFGYQDASYGVNPRLLASLAGNGGSVVGALDPRGKLVAFAYGFLGTDGISTYHYSQAAVVAPALQDQGLGRKLKMAQRDIALQSGTTSMRWSYDPLLTRNAHFNLDVLNATGVAFYPDMYGDDGSDRIMINWDLDQDPTERAEPEPLPDLGRASWGELVTESGEDTDRIVLALPSGIVSLRIAEPDRAALLAATVRDRLIDIFDRGYQAVSCLAAGDTAGYIFRPATRHG
jgi:predicted GNAT superfamily acetyltransferase